MFQRQKGCQFLFLVFEFAERNRKAKEKERKGKWPVCFLVLVLGKEYQSNRSLDCYVRKELKLRPFLNG